jgi:hypothetical protein
MEPFEHGLSREYSQCQVDARFPGFVAAMPLNEIYSEIRSSFEYPGKILMQAQMIEKLLALG